MGVEILKEDFPSPVAADTVEQIKAVKLDEPEIEKTLNPEETLDSTQETKEVAVEVVAEAKNDSFPKDAVDEWPAPKQIHTFYFVRYQPHEDPKLKAKFDLIDKEIQKRNKERSGIMDALKEKRAERAQIISQLKPLTAEDRQYRTVIDEKRKEMEPLHAALGKLRDANNVERGMGICSSEQELDSLIKSLQYRIQHESNTLTEEKQLLKDIKNLEGTRDKVIAYAAMKTKLQDSLGPKEAIQDQVKLIGVGLDGVRKEKNAIRSKIKSLEDVLKIIDDEIALLQEELTSVTQKRDKTYDTLNELRKSRDEGNASFYQYRSILNTARDLAAKKDVAALQEFCAGEVSKFISQWSNDKAFRDDYEKRILPSLDRRQFTRDGRMRNPDEKPIFSEPSAPVKEATDVPKPLPVKKEEKLDVVVTSKEERENPAGSRAKAADDEDFVLPEKPAAAVAVAVVDIKKLKELKREEEIAKAKQAQERKKRLLEKASAKATARAQKEAEKKQKEREKKAKKKVDSATELSEVETKAEESQESDEPKEAAPASKTKDPKENLKSRGRPRGSESRPKFTIPRKKKAQPYLKWAAFAASFLLVLAATGFFYYYYFPAARN